MLMKTKAQRLQFRLGRSASAALAIALCSTQAFASVVLYGGDANGGRQTCYQAQFDVTMVFDNFQLTESMTLTKLWGNYSEPDPTGSSLVGGGIKKMDFTGYGSAYYEIRTGVADGTPGTRVAWGTMSTEIRTTGRTLGETNMAESQWLGDLSGAPINLLAGDYWLGIAPISDAAKMLSTTSGGDSGPVGDPNPAPGNWPTDGNSFVMTWDLSSPDTVACQAISGDLDFSYGIEAVAVPETSTFVAGALLLLPAAVQVWRLRRRHAD
jgi:hypothetical protein